MKCVVIVESGGPEVLRLQEHAVPVPEGEQVLIRVQYSGVNRPDVFQRKGHYPAPAGAPADIPGLEVSGEIVACGPRVTQWTPGDWVCALLAGGGYAEYALAHQGHCLPLAPTVGGVVEAAVGAALPETLFTVWYNVFQPGVLKAGDRLLVHGGSGGIGTTTIQLASLLGLHVYTTAGSDERCRRCEEIGATEAVNYRVQDFADHWGDLKMNLILDSIGGDYFQKNLRLLASDGRLVQINSTGGRKVKLDLLQLMQQRFLITGSTLRAREHAVKEEIRNELIQEVWPLVSSGQFRPIIDRVLPIGIVSGADFTASSFHGSSAHNNAATEAHELLESGSVFGKLLLKWY